LNEHHDIFLEAARASLFKPKCQS